MKILVSAFLFLLLFTANKLKSYYFTIDAFNENGMTMDKGIIKFLRTNNLNNSM